MAFIKHLIECNCILPQFKSLDVPVFHKFVVFSELDHNEQLIKKLTKCPNCDLVHEVYDFGKSRTITSLKETSILSEEEIKLEFPEKLLSIINKYPIPFYILEHIQYVFKHNLWGEEILLISNEIDGKRNGKILKINGNKLFQIKSFEEQSLIE